MSEDVFAAMGISGFGKKPRQRQLDPNRFEKNKREEVRRCNGSIRYARSHVLLRQQRPATPQAAKKEEPITSTIPPSLASASAPPTAPEEPEFDPDEMGPPPPPSGKRVLGQDEGEPEFDVSDDEESDLPQFPTTHELLLKDHTKVVSALTLDPSGARVLSGSHDYDCKLWDFGGMDWRCKPFKTWEPAGTYYVRLPISPADHHLNMSIWVTDT